MMLILKKCDKQKGEHMMFNILNSFKNVGKSNDMKEETLKLGECIAEAQAGDTEAQCRLAEMYEDGDFGLEENEDMAYAWYLEAAEHGSIEAMCKLAEVHEDGLLGQYEDEEEAFNWYMKAAEHGHAESMYTIADAYYYGNLEVDEDEDEAYKWYRKAAKHGHKGAKRMLDTFD